MTAIRYYDTNLINLMNVETIVEKKHIKFKNMFKGYPVEKYHKVPIIRNYKIVGLLESLDIEESKVSDGLTKEDINEMYDWLNNNRDSNKYIFFNWNNIISCVNGILNEIDIYGDDIYYQSFKICSTYNYCKYLLGGEKRYDDILNMISNLKNQNCNIILLINDEKLQTFGELIGFDNIIDVKYYNVREYEMVNDYVNNLI